MKRDRLIFLLFPRQADRHKVIEIINLSTHIFFFPLCFFFYDVQHLEDDGAPKSVFDKVGGPNAPNPELPCPSGVTPIKTVTSVNKTPTPGNVTRKNQGNIVLQNCYYCGNIITGSDIWVEVLGDKMSQKQKYTQRSKRERVLVANLLLFKITLEDR